MADSVLKKEFKPQDVNRLRNLITGKVDEKTIESIGYKKFNERHKEGDIWEEDDKKWTIIDGVKQTYSTRNRVDDGGALPLFCPNCSSPMNHKFDKDYYKIHDKCYEC